MPADERDEGLAGGREKAPAPQGLAVHRPCNTPVVVLEITLTRDDAVYGSLRSYQEMLREHWPCSHQSGPRIFILPAAWIPRLATRPDPRYCHKRGARIISGSTRHLRGNEKVRHLVKSEFALSMERTSSSSRRCERPMDALLRPTSPFGSARGSEKTCSC